MGRIVGLSLTGLALAGCAKSEAPAAAPAPSGMEAAANADPEAHPAFAAHVAQLRRDGELELDGSVLLDADIIARLETLSDDGAQVLRLDVLEGVSDAWLARVEGYAMNAGFASVDVNRLAPDDATP